MSRFNLATLLAMIGALALGLAAMRDGSSFAEHIVFTLLLAVLFVGLVGATVRRRNGAWVGFAVCGWRYYLMAFSPAVKWEAIESRLLTTRLLYDLVERLHPPMVPPTQPTLNSKFLQEIGGPENLQPSNLHPAMLYNFNFNRSLLSPSEEQALDRYLDLIQAYKTQQFLLSEKTDNSLRIGQSLLALAFAFGGAMLGRFLDDRPPPQRPAREEIDPQMPPMDADGKSG